MKSCRNAKRRGFAGVTVVTAAALSFVVIVVVRGVTPAAGE
jgi:hypothetical protein